jgi:hypothetical protein
MLALKSRSIARIYKMPIRGGLRKGGGISNVQYSISKGQVNGLDVED